MSASDADDPQWSDPARERFRAAATTLVDTVGLHTQTLLGMTGRQAEIPAVIRSCDQLAQAAAAYAQAHLAYTGTLPPLGVAHDGEDGEDDTELADRDDQQAAALVSVLHRADYRVTDADAVLHAGRRAYQQVWPDDTDDDAASDVDHLGRALYQLQHAGGLAALDATPGLEATGATTWVLEATELLGPDPDDWPDDPFALSDDADQRLLHRLDEVIGRHHLIPPPDSHTK
jgi:hypothetical protein